MLGRYGSEIHGILDPNNAFAKFATGTVSGFFNTAWGLAERGHTVDAFCETPEYTTVPALGGVNFYPLGTPMGRDYDAYIAVNEPILLKGTPSRGVRACFLLLNDWSHCFDQSFDQSTDIYVSPSDSHMLHFRKRHCGRVDPKKFRVVPLSVNIERFERYWGPRRPNSMLFCSSPDRGLHHLLALMPALRRRIPEANLQIFYRLQPWIDNTISIGRIPLNPSYDNAVSIRDQLRVLGANGEYGVRVRDAVSPIELAKTMLATEMYPYTYDSIIEFTEGFSAATLEACAAGCVPIVSRADALPEVHAGGVIAIGGNPAQSQDAWLEVMTRLLSDQTFLAAHRMAAIVHARQFARQKVAKMWETLIISERAT